MAAKANLSDKQRRFVAEYLVDCNATQAAIRSGYSAHTAEVQGPRLLGNVRVAAAIGEGQARKLTKTGNLADLVIQELRRLGLSDVRKLFNEDGSLKHITDLDDDAAAAVAGVDSEDLFEGRGDNRELIGRVRKVRMWDKNAALVTLCKHLGLTKEQLDINMLGPVEIRIMGGRGTASKG